MSKKEEKRSEYNISGKGDLGGRHPNGSGKSVSKYESNVQNTDQMTINNNGIHERDSLVVRRSNTMIKSKYNSSLLERKLVAFALSRLKIVDGELQARMKASEIREVLGTTSQSLYEKLKAISTQAVQHYMILEDDESSQRFDVVSVITRATYTGQGGGPNSGLVLTFSPVLKKYTLDVTNRFTTLKLTTLLSFRHNSSYRLYEILMLDYYRIKDAHHPYVEVTYGLSELKFLLGLIDISDSRVEAMLKSGMDYDDILSSVKEPRYSNWKNFKARILDVSAEEMAQQDLCEIYFDYTPKRGGRGGKIYALLFRIYKKQKKSPSETHVARVNTPSEEDVLYLLEYTNGDLTNRDAALLLERADVERVRDVYDAAKRQKRLKNLMGWIIAAIDNGWDVSDDNGRDIGGDIAKPQRKSANTKKKKEQKGNFYNFEQRTYDWGDLEKQLLTQSIASGDADTAALDENDGLGFDIIGENNREENIVEEAVPVQKSEPDTDLSGLSLDDLDDDLKTLILDRLRRKKNSSKKAGGQT